MTEHSNCVADWCRFTRRPGEFIEVQAFDAKDANGRTGNYSATTTAEKLAELLDEMGHREPTGIYVIANALCSGVESRSALHRWSKMEKSGSTTDRDISSRRVFYADCDAERPRGTSATNEEMGCALSLRQAVEDKFARLGVSDAIGTANSGNGGAVFVALDDLPNDDNTKKLVEDTLHALAVSLARPGAKIDTACIDAKRLVPAPGTMKRKGAAGVAERPHRLTSFHCASNVQRLTLQQLTAVRDQLVAELTEEQAVKWRKATRRPEPRAERPSVAKAEPINGADVFGIARECPIGDVIEWLGLGDSSTPICPGCTSCDSGVAVVGNGLKCSHDRCSSKGAPGRPGFRTTIDLVVEVNGVSPIEAVRALGERFGFDVPKTKSKQVSGTGQKKSASRSAESVDEERIAIQEESKPANDSEPRRRFFRTDLGNAERLIAHHGIDLIFVPGLGWHAWTGNRWERDESGEVVRRAKKMVRAIYREAEFAATAAEAKDLASWAARSESRDRITAAVTLASTEAEVVVSASRLDADSMLLNVPNGTVDLRLDALVRHRAADRKDFITKIAGCAFEPNMPTPIWNAFLERVVPDADVRAFLQRWAGYCLTGSASEHALAFFYGKGGNGKGVFLLMLRKLLGAYGVKAPRGLLVAKRNEAHPTELMNLRGARMAWCSEVNENDTWDEAKVKDLASEDPITAHYMKCDDVEFMPTHKLVIAGNYKPKVSGTDDGIWRRLRLVPFDVSITEAEKDKDLGAKLDAELPGILAWAVQGCLDWQRDGLGCPAAIASATEGYRNESDIVGRFIGDRCVIADPRDADRIHTGATALYQAFTEWLEEQGEKSTWNQKRFAEQVIRKDHVTRKTTKKGIVYLGIGLRPGEGVNHGEPISGFDRAVGYS